MKVTIKPRKPIMLADEEMGPDVEYTSGFWNEEPEDAMASPATFPGRCVMGQFGQSIGEGCYITTVNQSGD